MQILQFSPKAIVFDFDGVLVSHSEFFKEEGWKKVFAPYASTYEPYFIEASSRFSFGKKGDRFDILRYVYERLRVDAIEDHIATGAALFDSYVQERILNVGLAPGARDTLEILSTRFPLYVNSGTATIALQRSVKALDIDLYFKLVLGGPASKSENMHRVASLEETLPTHLLLIGDSRGDVVAAEETGCAFIGVANEWNTWSLEKKAFTCIQALPDIVSLVSPKSNGRA
jgi:phosphoglycolate phosphatase-like HAD superfamily hydrolase